MKTAKKLLVAIVFSLAGAAVHANAAQGQHCDMGVALQLTSLAAKSELDGLAENGFSRTPQGRNLQMIAEDGASHALQNYWLHGHRSAYPV